MSENSRCPIWETSAFHESEDGLDGSRVNSRRAGGRYLISRTAEALLEQSNKHLKVRLTSWLIGTTAVRRRVSGNRYDNGRASETAPGFASPHACGSVSLILWKSNRSDRKNCLVHTPKSVRYSVSTVGITTPLVQSSGIGRGSTDSDVIKRRMRNEDNRTKISTEYSKSPVRFERKPMCTPAVHKQCH